MYAFNSAAIFLPGHPYIESTTVLSDDVGIVALTTMCKMTTTVSTATDFSVVNKSLLMQHLLHNDIVTGYFLGIF